jgi:Cell division and transport-associated protein TolQ (TC 2.C.1.2.1)
VVKLVLLVLFAASIISWTLILDFARVLGRARKLADRFEERFWSGGDLGALYKDLSQDEQGGQGLAVIFRSGFKEFVRLRKVEDTDMASVLHGAERSMHVALSHEMDRLEAHLAFLATVGSTRLYMGLFGTVWGIMQSFHALGNLEQATLALVTRWISEALVDTEIFTLRCYPGRHLLHRYSYLV